MSLCAHAKSCPAMLSSVASSIIRKRSRERLDLKMAPRAHLLRQQRGGPGKSVEVTMNTPRIVNICFCAKKSSCSIRPPSCVARLTTRSISVSARLRQAVLIRPVITIRLIASRSASSWKKSAANAKVNSWLRSCVKP